MFHSKELAQAVSELEPFANTCREKADQVSDDIRQLETYLSGKFIGIEIGLNIEDHKIDDEHMKLFELADHGKIGGFLLREILVWGKDESSQKFRLLYEKHLLGGGKGSGYQVHSEKRPLIECSLFDRLRMRSKLPLLVDHIKNCLQWT
jgi:hypothetical protein